MHIVLLRNKPFYTSKVSQATGTSLLPFLEAGLGVEIESGFVALDSLNTQRSTCPWVKWMDHHTQLSGTCFKLETCQSLAWLDGNLKVKFKSEEEMGARWTRLLAWWQHNNHPFPPEQCIYPRNTQTSAWPEHCVSRVSVWLSSCSVTNHGHFCIYAALSASL